MSPRCNAACACCAARFEWGVDFAVVGAAGGTAGRFAMETEAGEAEREFPGRSPGHDVCQMLSYCGEAVYRKGGYCGGGELRKESPEEAEDAAGGKELKLRITNDELRGVFVIRHS